ncbi:hypothetical protein K505DRAFT_320235 [Melanomma pulvis-pyrius CBS 109.77]|uniref:Cell wall mannoprotein PIR1-like C-terminal domain-containing protein n=1 Tax=Melanomma pulvis-pyrius CBS 109.77 TaxID=1314802 RepID=A0A6A6XW79_9PLEO|nr:hypothetical protein K505DRAFT_320235 [Melanomma pulvis-pyrius CBS 109.77]
MKTTLVALALAAATMAKPMPQASTPEGCSDSHSGSFQITVVNATTAAKRDVEKRQLAGILTLTLEGGILKDQAGRTGYIASNYQWQFDNPPQENAISSSGYSYCSNNSLALAGSAIFYQCWSGDFYNLYDRHWAAQCSPVYLVGINGGGTPPATQITDGQPQASTAIPISEISDGQPQVPTYAPPVSQISDGQPQAPTGGVPVTQISDGQPQAPTGVPVTQISDGQPQAPTGGAPVTQISDGQPQAPTGGAPVTQISDGQPQAPTGGAPVTQISDGQPQAPTGAPVTQISDGQPQAPSGVPVTQISDGQPQAPSAPPAPPVTQITDGQPQAPPATSAPPVTQISDGQPQAPIATGNYTIPSTAPPAFTGAAATPVYGLGAMAAGMMGVVAML